MKAKSNDIGYSAAVMPGPLAAQDYCCVIVRSPCVFTPARCRSLTPPPTRHTTRTYSCLHILPPTHMFTVYEAPEKMNVPVATFQKYANLFWFCNFSGNMF